MTFLANLPPHGPGRDHVLLAAIAAGQIDPPVWVRVPMGRVEIWVSADYLAIAGERVPMSAPVAQAAVDALDALLPTPAIVDAIEDAATIVPLPTWAPPAGQSRAAQTSSAVLALCEERTSAAFELRRIPAGQLVAGHRKDVVLARHMPPTDVVIYGARWPSGHRLQPLYPVPGIAGHEASYEDYSHGARAVRDACLLDGEPTTVTEILSGPEASLLGGPVARLRYASPLRSEVPPPPAPLRTLRRGDHGPEVQELQHRLGLADHRTTIDGVFGRFTEEAVKAFQEERGLEVDGIVGAATWAALRDEPPPTERAPAYPFVQARNYHAGRERPIRAVVLHTMEATEKPSTAENVAAWFAGPNAPIASAHFCVDADSTVQCVREQDTAFAAPGLNADGVQVELAGYAGQGVAGWADDYSQALLRRAAALVADLCRRHHLSIVALDAQALLRGERGITTHAEVTKAYRRSTHTDPGPTFPMAAFLDLVRQTGGS